MLQPAAHQVQGRAEVFCPPGLLLVAEADRLWLTTAFTLLVPTIALSHDTDAGSGKVQSDRKQTGCGPSDSGAGEYLGGITLQGAS